MKKLLATSLLVLLVSFIYPVHAVDCPPTPLPFVDNFDGPVLDSCWFWIREDTSHWSLTQRPGWMRIWTQPGEIDNWNNGNDAHNILLRRPPEGDYRAITRVQFSPSSLYQYASLLLYVDDANFLMLKRQYTTYGGVPAQGEVTLNFEQSDTQSIEWHPYSSTTTWLRFDKSLQRISKTFDC